MNLKNKYEYKTLTVKCSCGKSFITKSTIKKPILTIEICSECHPFYTKKQKIIDTEKRVDNFNKKFKINK
ncbi:MAG: 50S ribosomal protein L31 [Candidatus Azosocius agrarius]|nr:MAG: 50S ribosomal protein L31 [Gammaproteobacteria bacterium]